MKQILFLLLCSLLAVGTAQAQKKPQLPETFNFRRGVEAIQDDNYEEAATYFEKETAENPKNGYAHLYLCYAYQSLDDKTPADALTEVNLALKHLPKKDAVYRAQAYGARADLQTELGDTLRALDDLAQGIATDKEETDLLIKRADIYYAQSDYDRAEADYHEALRRDEACTTAYMGLGRNALERRDYAEATRCFDRVLRLDPSYTRAYAFRARSLMAERKYREAVADAISGLDGSGHADFTLYPTLRQLADSAFIHVETQLLAKAQQDNTNDFWLYDLANVYEQHGYYRRAISTYKRYLAVNPTENVAANYYIASNYTRLYDYPEALKYADAAVASDSTDADNVRLRGLIRYGLDQQAEALADLDRAVALAPDAAGAYSSRAWVRMFNGRLQEAFDDYNTAIALAPDEASLHLYRGNLYARLGDPAAARRDYETVVRLDTVPAEADAAMYAYAFLGNADKARALCDSVMAKAAPAERAGNFYNAACLYANLGQTDAALAFLEQAFEAGYRDFTHISRDFDMDPLRSLPRFAELTDQYAARYQAELNKEAAAPAAGAGAYERVVTEVPFTRESGIYKVKCTINGLPLHFYFDTGAADVTISSVEAAFMLKNGYLTRSDLGGRQYYGTASGDISEGTLINLRSVDFGGLTLTNVKASVVHSQRAPLLLGQSVLSRLGNIEIDYERNVLKITHLKAVGGK